MNSWKELIKQESHKDYYRKLLSFLQEDGKAHAIYPPKHQLFSALNLCPLQQTRALILGQDPYHGEGQAHGLSFSVQPGVDIPPSLRNIYRELHTDLGIDIPTHGCLTCWAQQGVLLLNTVLTVRQGQTGSHRNRGWETFTDTLIQQINQLDQPVAYLLWGSFARAKQALITNPHHLILTASHPSPLSAYNGFFGCKHFSQCNDFFSQHQMPLIDWRIA